MPGQDSPSAGGTDRWTDRGPSSEGDIGAVRRQPRVAALTAHGCAHDVPAPRTFFRKNRSCVIKAGSEVPGGRPSGKREQLRPREPVE